MYIRSTQRVLLRYCSGCRWPFQPSQYNARLMTAVNTESGFQCFKVHSCQPGYSLMVSMRTTVEGKGSNLRLLKIVAAAVFIYIRIPINWSHTILSAEQQTHSRGCGPTGMNHMVTPGEIQNVFAHGFSTRTSID